MDLDRFELALPETGPSRQRRDRTEPEGKRWVRRRENAKFTHNPHIALPTSTDYSHPLQLPLSTFPYPLPAYLPRTLPVPPARLPPTVLSTSSAGLFSLSLRGARRTLRARPASVDLVKAVETHLVTWLQGGTYLNPDQVKGLFHFPGEPVGGRQDIREVGREAARLVWAVKADGDGPGTDGGTGGFERYVVHCVARWYGVVSFSKETDGRRLTYLLRPNVTRPDPRIATLDTPPTTDVSDFHLSDTNLSDFNATTDGSDDNLTDSSDTDSVVAGDPLPSALSDIQESRPSSPDAWSVLGGPDFAVDDSDRDKHSLSASMESLSIRGDSDSPANTTLGSSRLRDIVIAEEQGETTTPSRARADRDHLRRLYPRSASSPSPVGPRSSYRFPTARKSSAQRKRKAKNKKGFAGAIGTDKGSFYDYLFA